MANLLALPDLWETAVVDRFCFSNPGKQPAGGLVKLRDLAENYWNVDSLQSSLAKWLGEKPDVW